MKRARPPEIPSRPFEWIAKALPSLDPSLQSYAWPYGPGALIDERAKIAKILEVAHSIRIPQLEWPGIATYYSDKGIGLLGMVIKPEEVFVDSDELRNILVDRVHHYFNIDWKMEVLAITSNPNDGMHAVKRQSLRVLHYQLTEEHLYNTVNKIDMLRSLYEGLKPETVDLIRRCTSHAELKRSMVVTYRPPVFVSEPHWE